MRTLPVLLAVLLASTSGRAAVSNGFIVPDGFEVSLYAGDDLAHDIFSMTTDPQGRLVVAGRGYVKILHDTDNDGTADEATEFVKLPKSGARGMYFDGERLIATGDNGLKAYRADGEPEKIFHVAKDNEHTANGIVKGPDGWFYVICGNDAGINAEHATGPGSPITSNVVAGALVRVSPDLKYSEIVAHGFRNPYDIDFDARGMLFTYDADGESDHYLPWYAGSRIFDIATGMEHGWIINGWGHSWSRPESNFDNVQRVFDVGRGSPTGVKVYQHHQFPSHYRNGLFAICWSYGRVYFLPLNRSGATVASKKEIFMQSATDSGFAPVDAVVGPKGDLFIAMGGRGTMGTVYKVSYTKNRSYDPIGQGVEAVIHATQPLSAWSRAKWIPLAKSLGASEFERASKTKIGSRKSRMRALEILVEVFNGVSPALAKDLVENHEPEIAARAVWALGRGADSPAIRRVLCEFTGSREPRIGRCAWEALITLPSPLETDEGRPDFVRGFESVDRRVRAACVTAARGKLNDAFQRHRFPRRISERVRLGSIMVNGFANTSDYNTCLFVFSRSKDFSTRLDAVRLLQKGLGDIKLTLGKRQVTDGFIAGGVDELDDTIHQRIVDRLAPAFPTGDDELDRELGRLLAMLRADASDLARRVAKQANNSSSPEDSIHYLQVYTQLADESVEENRSVIASAIARLEHQMAKLGRVPARNWPKHVAESFAQLLERDPDLGAALVADKHFSLPGHALLADQLKVDETRLAAAKKLSSARSWTPALIHLLSRLEPRTIQPMLRARWDDVILRDAIVRALARAPRSEDRERFFAGLESFDDGTVVHAANALQKLEPPSEPGEYGKLLGALHRLSNDPKKTSPRSAVTKLLQRWTGSDIEIKEEKDLRKSYQPWFDWFTETYDQEVSDLWSPADRDVDAFLSRIKPIDWDSGNAERGKAMFAERQCLACHATQTRIGPHLTGITKRFSIEDLFAEIVVPNRNLSPAYAPRIYETKSGESYVGFPVYNSPATTIVQTGPATTVRLTSDDPYTERKSDTSLMPAGLLDGLSDQQLADFYAFMKTL